MKLVIGPDHKSNQNNLVVVIKIIIKNSLVREWRKSLEHAI
jgi:hypothetical protein